jgi:hypothetical protein
MHRSPLLLGAVLCALFFVFACLASGGRGARGGFSADPRVRGSGLRGPRHPIRPLSGPPECAGPPAPLRERLAGPAPAPAPRSGELSSRPLLAPLSAATRARAPLHPRPLMIASAPPPGGFMR